MDTMEHNHFPPEPSITQLHLIDRAVIGEHLALFSTLDRHGLLNTLVPHHTLPREDPARHIIEYRKGQNLGTKINVETAYELGVVFGRNLVVLAEQLHPNTYLMPIVTEDKTPLINEYLKRSAHVPVRKLTGHDNDLHPDINEAVELFAERCRHLLPDKMLRGGDEAVTRGFHDYLSVITLLEVAEGRAQRSQLRRRLGTVGLVGIVGYAVGKWFGRNRQK